MQNAFLFPFLIVPHLNYTFFHFFFMHYFNSNLLVRINLFQRTTETRANNSKSINFLLTFYYANDELFGDFSEAIDGYVLTKLNISFRIYDRVLH